MAINVKTWCGSSATPAAKRNVAKILKNWNRKDKDRERDILQGDCGEWLELRKNLIIASNFGKMLKKEKQLGLRSLNLYYINKTLLMYNTPVIQKGYLNGDFLESAFDFLHYLHQ